METISNSFPNLWRLLLNSIKNTSTNDVYIDLHLKSFEKLGINIIENYGKIECKCEFENMDQETEELLFKTIALGTALAVAIGVIVHYVNAFIGPDGICYKVDSQIWHPEETERKCYKELKSSVLWWLVPPVTPVGIITSIWLIIDRAIGPKPVKCK